MYSACFFLYPCCVFFLSHFLEIFFVVFFYKVKQRNHFCLFPHQTIRISMRAAACEQCVRGRSQSFFRSLSLFSSWDRFDNQHQFLPSIIFSCVFTHRLFLFSFQFLKHTHTLIYTLYSHLFFKIFFSSCCLFVVLLMLIIVLFFSLSLSLFVCLLLSLYVCSLSYIYTLFFFFFFFLFVQKDHIHDVRNKRKSK